MLKERTTERLQRCIQACLDCQDVCVQTEAHCRRVGGEYAGIDHLKLLKDCAEACRVAADFMQRSSERQALVRKVCAEISEQCALDCGSYGEDFRLARCAEVASACAEACRETD